MHTISHSVHDLSNKSPHKFSGKTSFFLSVCENVRTMVAVFSLATKSAQCLQGADASLVCFFVLPKARCL